MLTSKINEIMNTPVHPTVFGRWALLIVLLSAVPAANAQAQAKASLLPVPAKGGPIASSVTASLDVSPTVDAIRAQGFDDRERLANEIDERLKTSFSRLNELKSGVSGLTEIGKREFEQGLADAQRRKGDLENSLKETRAVSSSNAWE